MNQQPSFGERFVEFVLKVVFIIGVLWAVQHVREHVFPKPQPLPLDPKIKFEDRHDWKKYEHLKDDWKKYDRRQPLLPQTKGENQ